MYIEKKREDEKNIITKMIALYCHGKRHGTSKGNLCPDCSSLLIYSNQRTTQCPYMETKTFCSKCPTPCYRPEMRESIRAVMRYAGIRMLFHNPILVIKHILAPKKKLKW